MKHPRETYKLTGHLDVIHNLNERFKTRKLPHALLFMGPKGIGKATLAYHLAYHLLAGSSEIKASINPDDPLYRRLAAQSHGDLLVLERTADPEGKLSREINMDKARQVTAFVNKTSIEGGWRVILIDSIDEMNIQSMNAILKCVEEPPRNCLFILICHQTGQLLPTILSRCEKVTFKPLKISDLQEIAQSHSLSLPLQDNETTYEMAQGSAGRLLGLVEQQGEQLYKQMEAAIIRMVRGEWRELYALINQCSPSARNEHNIDKFILLGDLLGSFVFTGIKNKLFNRKNELYSSIFSQRPLEQWAEIWDKIHKLFQESQRLSLDPFQTMLNAFILIMPPNRKF